MRGLGHACIVVHQEHVIVKECLAKCSASEVYISDEQQRCMHRIFCIRGSDMHVYYYYYCSKPVSAHMARCIAATGMHAS